jgi:hypothetical protein
MAEFEVDGVKYRSRKLNAFEQIHVFRKLAPILGSASSMIEALRPHDGATLDIDMGALMPLIDAIAGMPEDDVNFVLKKCLSVVQRAQPTAAGEGWADVWSAGADRPMFDDIDAVVLIRISIAVIQDNIGNFSSALPSR